MNAPKELKYTTNDEWVRVEENVATIGITDYAQDQLSDVVFVEIVAFEEDDLEKGETCAVVESVKAAADVYMPISGTVIEINEEIADSPEMVNEDPYGGAWLLKVEISDPAELEELMDIQAYLAIERDH